LQHLTAGGIVKVFESIIGQGRVVAHQETNTLIISGPAPMIKEIVQMVKTLDVPGRQKDVPQVHIYYVANAKASELAGVLQTVFSRKGMTQSGHARPILAGQDSNGAVPIPPIAGVSSGRLDETAVSSPSGDPDEGRMVGEVRIVPDERTNALIIKATAHDYDIVKETIKKLDILPRQVIIEVLVAEVALSDNFNLGIEWFIKTGMFAFSQSFGLGAASGLVATFVDSNDVRAFLTTLSTFTKINVVTSPHLLARDNKAARMQIGQEVPIVTGSQSTLTGAALGGQNVFQTIQQRDIGRIINITPHITEKRQVTLDINLEISDTLPSSTVRGTPSFSKRSINSSVVVEDRQTMMIGGIIDKSTNETRTGLPWLKDIPYIGLLFGTTAETTSRSELLILLTPHVVGSPEDGIVEMQRFKERLEMLQKEMKAVKKNE
jgi:general secretion pathway protein D